MRNKDYEELDAKTIRMKAYALSEYGVNSKEYKEMMSQD
jgi:formylglycine-generating enzyme required for sulfatase activity